MSMKGLRYKKVPIGVLAGSIEVTDGRFVVLVSIILVKIRGIETMSARMILLGFGLVLSIAMQSYGLEPAYAQVDPWTSVGSTGTVDEDDLGIVRLGGPGGVVTMRPAATGTLNIRYNVVAVDGVFGGDNYALTVRYRDDTVTAGRVIARLKQFNLAAGTETTLLTFDSNAFPTSPGYQVRSVASACGTSLNFFSNAYFVDVEIVKNNAAALPGLGMLKVGLSLC